MAFHQPTPNSTLPFWRTELHELDNHRFIPDLPAECDIVIVGAGYAGISGDYYILDDDPLPLSIVLLEARQTCSGATARNGRSVSLSNDKTRSVLTSDYYEADFLDPKSTFLPRSELTYTRVHLTKFIAYTADEQPHIGRHPRSR